MAARYDREKTWLSNLNDAPQFVGDIVSRHHAVPGSWKWCGVPVDSPLSIAAGPLLNGDWLLNYANLGFDILVYKTVRTRAHTCYELPNLVPVDTKQLSRSGTTVSQAIEMNGTWAVSFGMPSQAPDIWREDIAATRQRMPPGKALVVSVVGTQDASNADPQRSLEQLAGDFAQCARWAMEAGAHGVEANFSCPNVSTSDGQLYQQPHAAQQVAATIRDHIGDAPLVLKIGRMISEADAEQFVRAVGPYINGLAMTNSIAARVQSSDGHLLFDGQPRGICGEAILDASIEQLKIFRDTLTRTDFDLDLVGIGGISKSKDVKRFLAAGATSVALATAAMVNPMVGLKLREHLGEL